MEFDSVYFFPVFLALMSQNFSHAGIASTIGPPTKTYLLLPSSHDGIRSTSLSVFGGAYPNTPSKFSTHNMIVCFLFFFLSTNFFIKIIVFTEVDSE